MTCLLHTLDMLLSVEEDNIMNNLFIGGNKMEGFLKFTTVEGNIVCVNLKYLQMVLCKPETCMVWVSDYLDNVGYEVSEDEASRILELLEG